MLKVIIIEDCREDADVLKAYVKRFSDETGEEMVCRSFKTADEFLHTYTSKGLADVIFMDIEMPGTDGMSAAGSIRDIDPDVFIIFTTNIAKYAVHGYKVNALDYFLKPVVYQDFRMRMLRVMDYRNSGANNGKMVKISAVNGMKMVPVNDIYYVESNDHVLIYHTTMGTFNSREKTMRQVESELADSGFMRCNVCYLVNLRKCLYVDGGKVIVGRDTLTISRNRSKEFIETLAQYKAQ